VENAEVRRESFQKTRSCIVVAERTIQTKDTTQVCGLQCGLRGFRGPYGELLDYFVETSDQGVGASGGPRISRPHTQQRLKTGDGRGIQLGSYV
jgi:hypothetical protein